MSLAAFARLLGLSRAYAEPALYSARAAEFVLSRRAFIGSTAAAGALLASGAGFSFAKAEPLSSLHLLADGQILERWLPGERMWHFSVPRGFREVEIVRVPSRYPVAHFSLNPLNSMMWRAVPGGEIIA